MAWTRRPHPTARSGATAASLAGHIGRAGLFDVGNGIRVRVTVEDARETFGRLDYKITPIAGDGVAWIEARRVQLDAEAQP